MNVDIEPGAADAHAGRFSWMEGRLKWLFWICAAGLSPWVVYLYLYQTPSGPAHKIHLMSIGLVIAMMAGLLLTAWTYRQNSSLSVMAAAFTATAVVNSVRFRILTEVGGPKWPGSVVTLLVLDVIVVGLCVIVIRDHFQARAHVRWLPAVLAAAALALVPFLVIVPVLLPKVQTAYHLQLAWGGLDVLEVIALAATGFALHRRSAFVVVPATVTGTLLVCDAWLNIVPSTGLAFYEGVAMGVIELPLAALGFWVAARKSAWAARSSTPDPGIPSPADDNALR